MVFTSLLAASIAGQSLGAGQQMLRDTHDMAARLPMYDTARIDTNRGGIGSGLLDDTDVNQGVFAWNFDTFPTGARLDSPPDLSPINGGEVFGGTNTTSGGSVFQEATHTYIGFDPTNNIHIHTFAFSIRDDSGVGFIPSGTTLAGLPIGFLSSDIGTPNVGGNGLTFDGQVLGYFSASMDVYIGGSLATTDDFFASALSFAGANMEGGNPFADTLLLQGFTAPAGPDIAGFNIDRLVIRGTVAVAPAPGSLALMGMVGLTGIRRRR